MLTALEILGFKSFADRTRFEFPPGITVVVGPNGSGKSNIVDAIKWVLGEQSVKSLRGREMADVIFNGSGSRRALNAAEITLTFDNAKRLLDVDTPEVSITRRVYRSGEGEYLINRNPARLRDIRDLLSGTGMGTQAYSVIEQGKVDGLLQSSPKDRRLIFEEAAGISRFKARKLEAIKRLERVEQNLLRLSDIVDEVENHLRSVRAQAGKARRYKEHVDRLQELRTQVAQVDWNRLTDRLAEVEDDLSSMIVERDAALAESEKHEASLLAIDHEVSNANEAIRQAEGQIAGNRERIAAVESAIELERQHGVALEQEIARCRKQLVAMTAKAGDLEQQLRETTESLGNAEEHHQNIANSLVEAERKLAALMASIDQLRSEAQQTRAAHVQIMRRTATFSNEIGVLESQVSASAAIQKRSRGQSEELDQLRGTLQRQMDDLRQAREQLTQQATKQAALVTAASESLADYQRQRDKAQNELTEMRQRYSGIVERAAVLEDLVRRHDGLSDGVKEVLGRAANPNDRLFQDVLGLVADLFQVSVEAAPLVELALGQTAQHIVASRSEELLGFLQQQANRLGGRVGFVWLQGGAATDSGKDLEGQPGVLGRADRFVEAHPRCGPLAKRLLSRTWFVEQLGQAVALSSSIGPGLTFVTLTGELLEPDGTLVVGPRHGSTGLISRRSQLRALQGQIRELEATMGNLQSAIAKLDDQIAAQQRVVGAQSDEHDRLAAALAENRVQWTAAEERRTHLDAQHAEVQRELLAAERQHQDLLRRLEDARQKQKQMEASLAEMETKAATLTEQTKSLEKQRSAAEQANTSLKVERAKSEEKLGNLRARMRQYEESHDERHRAIEDARHQLAQAAERVQASQWNILHAEAEIAELYLRKEAFAGQTVGLVHRREELLEERGRLSTSIQKIHGRVRKLEERVHALELSANEARHERTTLADRFREDYGIELSELQRNDSTEQQHQREVVQGEIEELRHKINNLGNVNLEALDELEQLESRYKTLFDQYHDLVDAKNSLEKIIDKINADSRRLFAETLETVRGHFQTLFRDLFGGGHADIILEENVDILDSGIEIVARPPGKEPRSISLLSGGEKTMTCVALLLAIFRSRPSPFCVLDEVDAALDEANIDRFTQVLKDFLAWTQFIIVTHSKKTMTCANTIYGVTMQESGVTKQVSVRFEDVSDDGHIIDRTASGDETQAA